MEKHKITIGIPTYQRPGMLEKLLNSIFVGQIDTALIGRVDVVVVDNDAEKTAEATVRRLMQSAPAAYHLHYFDYPIKGLANVRNEIINQALLLKPDYILFVDDDQYVAPLWLNEIVSTIVNNHCDFVLGPVIPDFEEKVSPEISEWFRYYTFADQIALDFIDSGNLIMRAQFLQEQALRFDTRFNTMGAEDSYFGVSALKMGASIFWAKKAITYENIPAKRATLQWLIKRRFRGANTYTYIILLEKRYALIVRKILINFVYFLIGLFGLVLTPLKNFKYRYYGVLKLAESFGGFAGLMNIKFHEYLKGR
jgi:glycosyltransferase involved in cell wall biosynthesis